MRRVLILRYSFFNSKYTMSISLQSGTTLDDILHEETSRTRIVLIDESERLCSKEVSS